MGARVNGFYRQHVLSIKDFSRQDLELLFQIAGQMEEVGAGIRLSLLADKIMACVFFQASTRTRLSYESAMLRLGGGVIGFADPKMTRAGDFYEETLDDTIKMVSAYADVIVMRHFVTGAATEAATYTEVPIINGGDGYNEHPTQAMVDLYTIHKAQGCIDGLKVAIVGDLRQRSIRSFAFGLAHFDGVGLSVVAPPDQRFTQDTIEDLKCMDQGYEVFEDIHEVVDHVDVIYQMSVVQPSYERAAESAPRVKVDIPAAYRIDRILLEGRDPDLMVLHPLPRKSELAMDVDDLPQARYMEQAQNAVPLRMALLALLFGRLP